MKSHFGNSQVLEKGPYHGEISLILGLNDSGLRSRGSFQLWENILLFQWIWQETV
mgnify:CR=1 FL=1